MVGSGIQGSKDQKGAKGAQGNGPEVWLDMTLEAQNRRWRRFASMVMLCVAWAAVFAAGAFLAGALIWGLVFAGRLGWLVAEGMVP